MALHAGKQSLPKPWVMILDVEAVLWNRNRNRRNRNFLTSGTGTVTGTVTCLKVRTGTVINYGSGTGTRHKIMYLISFIEHFFHSHFTINLFKFMNFFLVKQLTICFLWSRYGAGTGTGTVTFSKVGTGTGTIIFQKSEPEPEP